MTGKTMTDQAINKPLTVWLFIVCGLIVVLILFGGFVRLSRAGLSMVEWHVITGVVPPMDETAWQEAFARYRQTPEFRLLNASMTVEAYKSIYWIEYTHRMLARFAGLAVVVPLVVFLLQGAIPRRRALLYLGIGALFVFQGIFGWLMVQSGLMDQPRVSPYRLTVHLLTALALLGVCLWQALRNACPAEQALSLHERKGPLRLAFSLLGILVVQIAYGGLVAGFRAGYLSNTFPLMAGALIPPDAFTGDETWMGALITNDAAVHFVHRWFAFAVLIMTVWLYADFRKRRVPPATGNTALTLAMMIGIQIAMGIGVILFNVPLSLALLHQAIAVVLFMTAILLIYQLYYER